MPKRNQKSGNEVKPAGTESMSERDLTMMLAKEVLKRTGSVELAMQILAGSTAAALPEAAALAAPAVAVAVAPEPPPVEKKKFDWHKVTHKCPRCDHVGPVDTDFGTMMHRGVERSQSWCHKCRGQASYYKKTRTYKTRNS